MAIRTGTTVIIVIFAATVVWVGLADPLVQIGAAFKGIDTSGQFGKTALIDGMISSWFNAILILVFGIMAWGVIRVVRRELTRGNL
jgi:hypothetical protein